MSDYIRDFRGHTFRVGADAGGDIRITQDDGGELHTVLIGASQVPDLTTALRDAVRVCEVMGDEGGE